MLLTVIIFQYTIMFQTGFGDLFVSLWSESTTITPMHIYRLIIFLRLLNHEHRRTIPQDSFEGTILWPLLCSEGKTAKWVYIYCQGNSHYVGRVYIIESSHVTCTIDFCHWVSNSLHQFCRRDCDKSCTRRILSLHKCMQWHKSSSLWHSSSIKVRKSVSKFRHILLAFWIYELLFLRYCNIELNLSFILGKYITISVGIIHEIFISLHASHAPLKLSNLPVVKDCQLIFHFGTA